MNREKFKEAVPVHEKLVDKENEIEELKNRRDRLNAELSDINKAIALADTERKAIYEEFKVI